MKKILITLSLSTAVIAASSAFAQSPSIFTPACPDSSAIKIDNNFVVSAEGYTTLSENITKINGNTIDFQDANFDLDNAAYHANPQVLKSAENIKCEYTITNNGGKFILAKNNSSGLVYTYDHQAGQSYWGVTFSPTTPGYNNLVCYSSIANCSLSTSSAQ